jgi:hypothetical protein
MKCAKQRTEKRRRGDHRQLHVKQHATDSQTCEKSEG